MSHEDPRYLSPEHRQLLHTGAPLPLTLTLLDHADYMEERAEKAEALVKEWESAFTGLIGEPPVTITLTPGLVWNAINAQNKLVKELVEALQKMVSVFSGDVNCAAHCSAIEKAEAALARATGTKGDSKHQFEGSGVAPAAER